MKSSILTWLAITSIWVASAQNHSTAQVPQTGKELPRTPLTVYASTAEWPIVQPVIEEVTTPKGKKRKTAAELPVPTLPTEFKYMQPLTEWQKENTPDGVSFTLQISNPFAWVNRQVLLHVGEASSAYEVRINDRPVAFSRSGATPAEFNLTRHLNEGSNRLTLLLREEVDAPLESRTQAVRPKIDGCFLMSQPTIRLRDLVVRTTRVGATYNAEVGIIVKSDALNPKQAKIYYELLTPEGQTVTHGVREISLDMRREDTLRFVTALPDTMLWSAERPTRYTLRLRTQSEGRYTEYHSFDLGFRTIAAEGDGLRINDRPAALRTIRIGHEPVDTTAIQQYKAQGYNALRLPAGYRNAERVLDLCDSLGFYVVAQAAIDTHSSGESIRRGGNPTNDPAWSTAYLDRIEESYHTTKLHPSVIAFSLAERSANGINLYEGYLRMKVLEKERPVIYPAVDGQWNSDPLALGEE